MIISWYSCGGKDSNRPYPSSGSSGSGGDGDIDGYY